MIIRLTFTQEIPEALRKITGALGERKQIHERLGLDLRRALVEHITTTKVPGQNPGIEFWQQAAQSIEVSATDDGADVDFTKVGIRLRYYGGDVFPGKNPARSGPNFGNPTKALSVPTKEVPTSGGAYVPPFRAGLLAFIRRATGTETVGYLVSGKRKVATRGPNKGKEIIVPMSKGEGGRLLYVLRSVTHHRPDHSFIPDDDRLSAILSVAAAAFIYERSGGTLSD